MAKQVSIRGYRVKGQHSNEIGRIVENAPGSYVITVLWRDGRRVMYDYKHPDFSQFLTILSPRKARRRRRT